MHPWKDYSGFTDLERTKYGGIESDLRVLVSDARDGHFEDCSSALM